MSIFDKTLNNRSLGKIFNKIFDPYVTIFTLHRAAQTDNAFRGIDIDLLDRSLAHLSTMNVDIKSIDEIVTDALHGKKYSRPCVAFTLDDGYEDQLTQLVPTLLKYNAKPTLFVITDFIDGKDWMWDAKIAYITWHTQLPQLTFEWNNLSIALDFSSAEARKTSRRKVISNIKLLPTEQKLEFIKAFAKACEVKLPKKAPADHKAASWEQLRAAEQQGLHIGSHTKSHVVFNSTTDEILLEELHHAQNRIAAEIKSPSQVLCYPLGTRTEVSERHSSVVKTAGHPAALTTLSSPTSLKTIALSPFQIQRIGFPFQFETFVRYASWSEAIRSKLPF